MPDLSSFMDIVLNEANDTQLVACPPGEYTAVAGEPKIRDGEKNGVAWAALDIPWEVDGQAYPAVKEATGRDKVSVKQGIFLDLTDSGNLDMGKGRNVNLGRLREALGLNKPGFSIRQIQGQTARIRVEHRTAPDGAVFADVKGVAAL